jgi:hypothetical protein
MIAFPMELASDRPRRLTAHRALAFRNARLAVGAKAGIATLAVALVADRPAAAQAMSTTPEAGYDTGEVPGARSVGMGGALTALGVSTPALFLNPANMPFARVYHLEAIGGVIPEAGRTVAGAAIVDSALNQFRLAGGLGGAWSQMDPSGMGRTWTDVRMALALPLGDAFAVGATGRWLRVEQAVSAGPFGHSFVSDGTPTGPILNTVTIDLGATLALGDAVRVGVVGHNLTAPGTSLAPTTAAFGIGYGTKDFAVEADGMADFTTYSRVAGRAMVGGEVFAADHYPIRAGWRYDGGMHVHAASLGFGYVEPTWSAELSVRRDLLADHGSTLVVLSLRYFYDSGGTSTPADAGDGF